MLPKRLLAFIIVLIIVIPVLAEVSLGNEVEKPSKTEAIKSEEGKASAVHKDNEAALLVQKPFEYATEIKEKEQDIRKIFAQVIVHLKDQKNKTDIFNYAIAIVILAILFYCFIIIKRLADDGRNVLKEADALRKGLNKEITEQLDLIINAEMLRWARKADERIVEYLGYIDKDFSKSLEERYLSMEFVYLNIWEKISDAMVIAWGEKNVHKFFNLWNTLYVGQLALRQMLSGDDMDVFNGMCELRAIAKEGLVRAETLWDFICLLRKQKRLSTKTLAQAQELGSDLGKTFGDCKDALSI